MQNGLSMWDKRFIELAAHIGAWSKDPNRKVGCVIVDGDNIVRSSGFNGFPRGVNDVAESWHDRPAKYTWTEHAERNAIFNAARTGVSVAGCRMYVNWFPCMDCARAIVQSGVVEVVTRVPDMTDSHWGEDYKQASILFEEVGIRVRTVQSGGG